MVREYGKAIDRDRTERSDIIKMRNSMLQRPLRFGDPIAIRIPIWIILFPNVKGKSRRVAGQC